VPQWSNFSRVSIQHLDSAETWALEARGIDGAEEFGRGAAKSRDIESS